MMFNDEEDAIFQNIDLEPNNNTLEAFIMNLKQQLSNEQSNEHLANLMNETRAKYCEIFDGATANEMALMFGVQSQKVLALRTLRNRIKALKTNCDRKESLVANPQHSDMSMFSVSIMPVGGGKSNQNVFQTIDGFMAGMQKQISNNRNSQSMKTVLCTVTQKYIDVFDKVGLNELRKVFGEKTNQITELRKLRSQMNEQNKPSVVPNAMVKSTAVPLTNVKQQNKPSIVPNAMVKSTAVPLTHVEQQNKPSIVPNAMVKSKAMPPFIVNASKIQAILKNTFKIEQFKPNQYEVIAATLSGFDCFVLMGTGFGKSICYQLPAIYSRSATLVISPLISLVMDQMEKARSLGIECFNLSNAADLNKIMQKSSQYNDKSVILFCTPEKVYQSADVKTLLNDLYKQHRLDYIVIDECHCISIWGHDFRPTYSKLGQLRIDYPGVPILALTATATRKVRRDIATQLNLVQVKWFMSNYDRKNLHFSVRSKPTKIKKTREEIVQLLLNDFKGQSGIVYSLSIDDSNALAQLLKDKGIKAAAYNSSLGDKMRNKNQADWCNGDIDVIVATTAFGMGIDKSDVQFVVHETMPSSYSISEATSIDGNKHSKKKKTNCSNDVLKTHETNLDAMVAYAESTDQCRHVLQRKYLAEYWIGDDCQTSCDNCLKINSTANVDAVIENNDTSMDDIYNSFCS